MKKLIILCLLLFATHGYAADPKQIYYHPTDFTGGTAGVDLDAIDGATLVDGAIAYVIKYIDANYTVTAIYRLDADSGAAEAGIRNIAPDTNAGDKRWILVQPPYCFGTVEPTDDLGGELLWVDTN